MTRLAWSGTLLAVQPRIDLLRSTDDRHHPLSRYLLVVADHGGRPGVYEVSTLKMDAGVHAMPGAPPCLERHVRAAIGAAIPATYEGAAWPAYGCAVCR